MTKAPNIVLGVTGSIAAYKALDLVGRLRKKGCRVTVIMTGNACQLVGPASFEALSGNPVARELFPDSKPQNIEHISLAQLADVLAIVPASANFIAKAAAGIADDLLTTVALAVKAPVLLAPAMNVNMWQNRIVRQNVKRLTDNGWRMVEPESGRLACGTEGSGRLASLDNIENEILGLLGWKDDYRDIPLIITAGRTEEPWDPVRFISNRSSGKMGMALAEQAARRGAKVTLISGPADVPAPQVFKHITVNTAAQMSQAVLKELPYNRALIMAAAVADYAPKNIASGKLKKTNDDDMTLILKKNPDIIQLAAGRRKAGTVLVGFALETDNLIANARKKLSAKKLDLIVANPAKTLSSENIQAVIIDKKGKAAKFPPMPKSNLAGLILDRTIKLIGADK
ncbi:MAG: bifunctional phosphopantothenoylcysteine decarboxylase/phosphopantothenate--cysteine ligase CoaBC [Candidatus Edwardsbacteria bacterium]|nr:bifunctional phosphopantothenoylcysteine decarboxylase/phosphopantothenate--cysteine ligase CoaBC [Candidatus Edwardsbacteria bacterium]